MGISEACKSLEDSTKQRRTAQDMTAQNKSLQVSLMLTMERTKQMAKKSQEQRILEYIERYGSISTFEAFTDLGITRLASRIFDLSQKGFDFDREQVSATNRLGEPTYYTRYSLKERADA